MKPSPYKARRNPATQSGGTATDLSYTASTRLLASSTGSDVTLPLVTSTDAGLAPASEGGTSNFLRADATWAAPVAPAMQLAIPFHSAADSAVTMLNQPSAARFLSNAPANITKADLTNYTQVRLLTRVTASSASVNSPRIYLRYRTTFSNTVGDFLQIGASEVECSLASTGFVDSGWINLVSGAQADVFLTVIEIGGDGAADPAAGMIFAHFR